MVGIVTLVMDLGETLLPPPPSAFALFLPFFLLSDCLEFFILNLHLRSVGEMQIRNKKSQTIRQKFKIQTRKQRTRCRRMDALLTGSWHLGLWGSICGWFCAIKMIPDLLCLNRRILPGARSGGIG
jgi:hypothetical protein